MTKWTLPETRMCCCKYLGVEKEMGLETEIELLSDNFWFEFQVDGTVDDFDFPLQVDGMGDGEGGEEGEQQLEQPQEEQPAGEQHDPAALQGEQPAEEGLEAPPADGELAPDQMLVNPTIGNICSCYSYL